MSSLSGLQGDLVAVGVSVGVTRLLMRSRNAVLGNVTLDASVKELHDAQAIPTSHPVEADPGSPSSVSDHVLVKPLGISIDGIISNTPAVHAGAVQTLLSGGTFDPAQQAHQEFLGYLQNGALVTVETTLKTYRDMVFRAVKVDRDAPRGNALHFTAVLQQVKKTELLVQEPRGLQAPELSTKRAGRIPTEATTPPVKAQAESALTKMSGWRPTF